MWKNPDRQALWHSPGVITDPLPFVLFPHNYAHFNNYLKKIKKRKRKKGLIVSSLVSLLCSINSYSVLCTFINMSRIAGAPTNAPKMGTHTPPHKRSWFLPIPLREENEAPRGWVACPGGHASVAELGFKIQVVWLVYSLGLKY